MILEYVMYLPATGLLIYCFYLVYKFFTYSPLDVYVQRNRDAYLDDYYRNKPLRQFP